MRPILGFPGMGERSREEHMTVAAILAHKGRRVVATTPSARVAEAVATLSKHRIGALVVTEASQNIVGIVSERDIVRALAAGGAAVLDGPVAAIMTREVTTCSEGETINDVMAKMTGGRFRHLPVVSEGRLAGIVSIGDVVKARIEEVERDASDLRSYIATA
jgi:CBS domain-containing protein